MNQKTILHLPKWYPNRNDDLFGIFTKRHILATLGHVKPIVVFGVVDDHLKRPYEIVRDTEEGIDTTRFYFKKHFTKIGLIDRIIKMTLYFFLLNKCVKEIKKSNQIDLIHVHVLLRTGIFAFTQKRLSNIPYIITEHWSIYLPQKKKFLSIWRKKAAAFIVKRASNLNTVSQDLLNAMNGYKILNPNQNVIGNSVDVSIFKPALDKKHNSVFNLITVVEFNERDKNICGLLDAIQGANLGAKLNIVGYGRDEMLVKNYAKKLGLEDNRVEFHNKMYQEELASFIAQQDAFVLFSKTENLPCVIIEAMACGIPVIATDVGGVKEMIQEENGILIPSEDKKALLEAISRIQKNKDKYDAEVISKSIIDTYSSGAIGEQFNKIYEGVL